MPCIVPRDIQSESNQTHDLSAREVETELSSQDYTSIHLQGTGSYQTMMPCLELEIGGRYITVAKQEPHNNYDEVADPPPVNEHILTTVPEGYDVPKPQNKATRSLLSLNWDKAEGYEKPESVVKHRHNAGNTLFSPGSKQSEIETANNGVYANDLPQPLRKSYDNVVDITSRKESGSSLMASATPQEKFSPKVLKTYSSYDHLEKLPLQNLRDYVNIPKAGSLFNQRPPVLGSPHENSINTCVAEPATRVKMLKKPALPSKLFKPTAELSQIAQGSSEEPKHRHEPLMPKGMEKKSLHQPTPKTQTWTADNNVNSKPPRPNNYMQLDITSMDPRSNYEQV